VKLTAIWKFWTTRRWEAVCAASCTSQRCALRSAGLTERSLRKMAPEDRVRALEGANLDPYDYIYLAC